MAIYHFNSKIISRGKKQSAVAAAAYRSGDKITDERIGKEIDFSRKREILHSEILLPDGAPDRWKDRSTLWNDVEKNEKRKDAQLAREIELALPREMDQESQIQLAKKFFMDEIVSQGMVIDFSMHAGKKAGNPHVHAMATMREIEDGHFGKKNRSWNDKKFLLRLRERWAAYVNEELERRGIHDRVDHRSFRDRGLDELPTIHEGWKARQMERNGEISERMEHNRRVRYWNMRHRKAKKDYNEAAKKRDDTGLKLCDIIDKADKHLSSLSRYGLKNPTQKTRNVLQDLLKLAELGSQDAAGILVYHSERTGKDMMKDWQYMTQADRDEAKLRNLYRDDY